MNNTDDPYLKSLRLLEKAFDCSPNNVFVLDASLRIVHASKTALQSIGYGSEDLGKISWTDIESSIAADTALRLLQQRQESSSSTLLRKNGTYLEVAVDFRTFTDEEQDYILATVVPKNTNANETREQGATSVETTQPPRVDSGENVADLSLYQTIVQTAQEGIWQLDVDDKTTFVNDFLARLLGYTKEEMIGKLLFDFMDDAAKALAVDMLAKRKEGLAEQHEFRFKKKDGQPVYTLLRSSPIYHQGQYAGALAMVLDISERKKSGEELVLREKYFRSLFEHSFDGIALMSAEGVILDVSPSAETIFGCNRSELIGNGRSEFIVAQYLPQVIATIDAVVKDPLLLLTISYECVRKDGKKIWIECSYKNLLNEAPVHALVLNFRDITERQQAEERNRFKAHLLNAVGQAVIATDLQGTITFWNNAAAETYGWTQEEALGKNIIDLVPSEQSKEQAADIMAALSKGNTWTGEFEVQRKDGSTFPALVTDSPIANADGTLSGVVGVSSDLSARKNAERLVKESEERYRKAQQMGKLGHWERDLSNDQLFWSDELFNIFGIDPAMVSPTYQLFLDFVHPEDREWFIDHEEKFMAGLQPFDLVHRIVLHDGTVKYLHEVGELQRNGDGEPVRLVGMVQDVTAHQLVERALRHSQQQLSVIFNSSVNGMALYAVEEGNELRFEAVNDSLCAAINISSEEAVGRLLQDVIDGTNLQHLLPGYDKAINTGLVQRFTATSARRLGNRTIEFTVVPIKDKTGKVARLLSVSNDITEQRIAEEQLRLSQQNYKLLFDENPVPLWMLSSNDLKFIEVNAAAIKQYGYTRETFLQMHLQDIKSPADIAMLERYRTRKAFSVEVRHRKQNGEEIHVQITTNPIQYRGQDVWLVGARDITKETVFEKELKEKQQQLTLIFDSTVDDMWLLKVEGPSTYRILNINSAYSKTTGLSRNEAIGSLLTELFEGKQLANFMEKYEQTRLSGETITFNTNISFVHSDLAVKVTLIPIKAEDGTVQQILGIGHDLTEQERTRKELVQMNEELRELASHLQNFREEERANIAREIHDELGQQLTCIKMDLAWLKKNSTALESERNGKIRGLLSLTDSSINTVRKIASELRPSILDTLGLAEAIDWQSREISDRSNTKVAFTSNAHGTKFSAAISIAVFRIFQEALTNVARHANAANVICSLIQQQEKLMLFISDDGQGFDMSAITTRRTLGLMGIKERVTMLNGQYTLHSAEGKGTTLQVEIPLAQ